MLVRGLVVPYVLIDLVFRFQQSLIQQLQQREQLLQQRIQELVHENKMLRQKTTQEEAAMQQLLGELQQDKLRMVQDMFAKDNQLNAAHTENNQLKQDLQLRDDIFSSSFSFESFE